MRRSRLGPLVVLLVVGGAACNGPTSADPTPAPSPTAAAASPSPSPAPSPSPSPAEVLPANDVDDPVAALEAIVAYRDWLFENPDPDKLALIYAERCDCYEEVRQALEVMLQEGESASLESARQLRNIQIVERSGPSAQLRYESDFPQGQVVNSRGRVIQEVQRRGFAAAEAVLVREGGRWRVVALILR